MPISIEKTRKISQEVHCGLALAKDLLVLAGGDEKLVIEASERTMNGVESLKAYIIDKRFSKLERK